MTEEREIYQGEADRVGVGQGESQNQGQEIPSLPPQEKDNNSRSWYKRIEKLLFLYPTIDHAIKHLETIIAQIELNKTPNGVANYRNDGPPSTDDISSSTERFADKRITSKDRLQAKINRLKAGKEAVAAVYERLGEEDKELVRKWYFEDWRLKRTDKKIWRELNTGKVSFYIKKDKIVKRIAEWLGEV